MTKISQITQLQLDNLQNAKNQAKVFKNLVNLDPKVKYRVGDTMIRVDNASFLDIFKTTFKDKDIYYLIVNVIDSQMAFAYSLYPA